MSRHTENRNSTERKKPSFPKLKVEENADFDRLTLKK